VIASKICFQEAAKPPSMTDMKAQNSRILQQGSKVRFRPLSGQTEQYNRRFSS
jgi:hypothetical protein